jgi:hypothetical protein
MIQNAYEVVKLLLQHHANPQILCNGHSPLSLAITRGNDMVSFPRNFSAKTHNISSACHIPCFSCIFWFIAKCLVQNACCFLEFQFILDLILVQLLSDCP